MINVVKTMERSGLFTKLDLFDRTNVYIKGEVYSSLNSDVILTKLVDINPHLKRYNIRLTHSYENVYKFSLTKKPRGVN